MVLNAHPGKRMREQTICVVTLLNMLMEGIQIWSNGFLGSYSGFTLCYCDQNLAHSRARNMRRAILLQRFWTKFSSPLRLISLYRNILLPYKADEGSYTISYDSWPTPPQCKMEEVISEIRNEPKLRSSASHLAPELKFFNVIRVFGRDLYF